MGGRKSYPLERVVGKGEEVRDQKQDLVKAIRSEKPKGIVAAAVQLLTSSSTALEGLVKATEFFEVIRKNAKKPQLNYQERKELVTKEWTKIKEEHGLETSSELDRIFIDSAATVVRRGKK